MSVRTEFGGGNPAPVRQLEQRATVGRQEPQSRSGIARCGEQSSSVRAESHVVNRAVVVQRPPHREARVARPKSDRTVGRRRGQPAPVWTERGVLDRAVVANTVLQTPGSRHIPGPDGMILAHRQCQTSIGAETNQFDGAWGLFGDRRGVLAVRPPNLDASVGAVARARERGENLGPIRAPLRVGNPVTVVNAGVKCRAGEHVPHTSGGVLRGGDDALTIGAELGPCLHAF